MCLLNRSTCLALVRHLNLGGNGSFNYAAIGSRNYLDLLRRTLRLRLRAINEVGRDTRRAIGTGQFAGVGIDRGLRYSTRGLERLWRRRIVCSALLPS